MDNQQLRQWEGVVDDAGVIGSNLPDGEIGSEHIDGPRKWKRVQVIGGAIGGRWAYWQVQHKDPLHLAAEKVDPNTAYEVIADRLFNGDAWHFAGMLAIPYNGVPAAAWVLVEPRITEGPKPKLTVMEPMSDGKRYERSKEVYDVATGESELLP